MRGSISLHGVVKLNTGKLHLAKHERVIKSRKMRRIEQVTFMEKSQARVNDLSAT